MQALKLLVIGMGIVVAVATAALVTVIVHRAGQLGGGGATTVTAGPGAADRRPIMVPAGFRVAATELSGDRLLVRLEGREPGGSSDEIRLLVLDLGHDNARRTLRLILPSAEGAR